MVDISLHKYESGEQTSALNAAHKYRLAVKSNNDILTILRIWQIGKLKALNAFANALREKINEQSVFGIAFAPSNTTHFNNDIKEHLKNIFPNSVDISNCFSKINGFEAGIINKILTPAELRDAISLNAECFGEKVGSKINNILLVDDVYSLGNTFNAMKLNISEIDNTKEIVTAAILRTT
jgi:hypothetical protein